MPITPRPIPIIVNRCENKDTDRHGDNHHVVMIPTRIGVVLCSSSIGETRRLKARIERSVKAERNSTLCEMERRYESFEQQTLNSCYHWVCVHGRSNLSPHNRALQNVRRGRERRLRPSTMRKPMKISATIFVRTFDFLQWRCSLLRQQQRHCRTRTEDWGPSWIAPKENDYVR